MFVAEERINGEYVKIGCLGFRLINDEVDVYNIIRGRKPSAGKIKMRETMSLMCSYIKEKYAKNISCVVLKNNPALAWYENIGFKILKNNGDSLNHLLDDEKFKFVKIKVTKL